jgi:hypothetical protein
MSATGRSDVRVVNDLYATPSFAIDAILPHLPVAGAVVLESSAGSGAIIERLLASGVEASRLRACEIDPRHTEKLVNLGVAPHVGDFLSSSWSGIDLILMNPPYSDAQEFIEHSIAVVAPRNGTVAALLRINFLEGQKRLKFHRAHPCDLFVLPRRPSFTGGGTDATGYCWLVWGPGRGGHFSWLDVPTARTPR